MKRAALVVLAACSAPSSGPKFEAAGASMPHRGGVVRYSFPNTVATLDPTIAYDEGSYIVLRSIVEPLLDYAPSSTDVVGRLAERWEVSADATTYHFWLRPDARFSDGTPVVAGDVKYALERALRTPDSPFGQWLSDVIGADAVLAQKATDCVGITTPSEHELIVKVAHPNAGFLYTFAAPFTAPQRREYVEKTGEAIRHAPLGNGPYLLDRWSEGEVIALRRSPTYAGTQSAYPDGFDILEAVARDTQFMMLEQGELDTAYRLSSPDLMWVESQPRWRTLAKTSAFLSAQGFRFDVTQKPFDDARVRRAFNLALDRDHVSKLLAGAAIPAHGMLPPSVPGRDETMPACPHDPARARALLAEAGHGAGLSVEIVTIGDEDAEKLAASFQADLSEVGVTARISVVSFSVYLATVGKRGGPALSYAGWIGDSPDPTSFFDVKFHSRAIAEETSTNDGFYANPRLDALLDRARADGDPRDRDHLYQEVEHLLAEDPPWVFSYHDTTTEVSQPYLRDMRPHPVWMRDFSNVWLDLDADGERPRR